jgi:acetyl-CoA synthetase
VVITADEGMRGNKHVPLKRIVDEALRGAPLVSAVLVARRTGAAVPMTPGRDLPLDEALSAHRAWCPAEVMEAEDPLFILYTSGSTGKPKGLVHSTGGYLTYAASTHREVFDLRPDDVHFCAADLGWITGHSYILYGPLANGTTSVLFEGIPTWPDPSRLWQVVDQVGATVLYTSPTALRTLIREGDQHLLGSSRASLRLLGTVGEPINPEVWRWYHDQVGQGRCPVVDTWWQTETGGVQISPIPGATPLLPGSATLPLPGVEPLLVSPEGAILEGNDVSGLLCLRGPTPGFARTIWGDHRRYLQTYWLPQHGLYLTGDGARRDGHGYIWITGRVDDVINVSGHRLGTAEVESALVAHPSVAEAAVVPCPHDIKGQGIFAYVVLVEGEHRDPAELVGALKEAVRKAIGPIATPDHIILAPGLPKTRSGKLMRRILRKIAEGETESLGDLSTLADPEVVAALIGLVRG